MTWSITDWSAARAWNNAALLNEFVDAINERLSVIGHNPLPAVVAGDSVQIYSLIESWQAAIEVLVPHFVVSHAAGAALGAGYYDGKASVPTYADLAAAFSAAGLAHSTWRAYPTRPSKGGVDQSRQIAADDVIGTWLFADLQKILNVLVWTPVIQDAGQFWRYETTQKSSPDWCFGSDWAAAKSHAETDFAAAGTSSASGSQPSDAYAWAFSQGKRESNPTPPPDYDYYAGLARCKLRITVTDLPTTIAHAVEFYAETSQPGKVFDDNGDPLVDAGALSLYSTVAATTDADVPADWLGSLDQPNWCATPDEDGEENAHAQGWVFNQWACVIRYDVAGGFEYV